MNGIMFFPCGALPSTARPSQSSPRTSRSISPFATRTDAYSAGQPRTYITTKPDSPANSPLIQVSAKLCWTAAVVTLGERLGSATLPAFAPAEYGRTDVGPMILLRGVQECVHFGSLSGASGTSLIGAHKGHHCQ